MSVPPYHVAGIAAILSNVFAGRRLLQLPTFEPGAWIDLVRAEGVTSAMVVPTMLARIVEHLDAEGPSSPGLPTLRALSYGGGRMPQPVIEKALDLLPDTSFVNAYGLTETSSTVTLLGPDEHRAAVASDDPKVRRRIASVGRPLPGIEVSIRDEAGAETPDGEPGDIWLRGEQVSGEYREQGSRLTDEGWFPTNDGGWLDDEGFLFVTGRIDDVIVKGGQNISPGEIEEVLLRHPAVADTAAIGLPDREWGERIVVAVVVRGDVDISPDDLQDLVRHELRSNRTPDLVEFVDELPYNDTGKLLRRVLRERLAHLGPTSGALPALDQLSRLSSPNTSAAAASVSLISASAWVTDTKPASKAEGARYTPRSSMPWKNLEKRALSHAMTSANELTRSLSVKKRPNMPPTDSVARGTPAPAAARAKPATSACVLSVSVSKNPAAATFFNVAIPAVMAKGLPDRVPA